MPWPLPFLKNSPIFATTTIARGSFRCFRRNDTGSEPAASASSSMNDSMANTLAKAPSDLSDERHVVGAIVAVAARALGMAHDDVRLAHAQHQRELLAQVEDALRVRPHLELGALPLRDGAGGPDRSMGDERLRIARLQGLRAARTRGVVLRYLGDDVLVDMRLEPRGPVRRRFGPRLPLRARAYFLLRLDGFGFGFCKHTEEAPVADDCYAVRNFKGQKFFIGKEGANN